MTRSTTFGLLVASGLALSLAACGGGGGGGGGGGTPPPPLSGTVSGTAVKGPVNGGTMTAYRLSNGVMGTEITHTATGSDGSFSLSMGSYAGPVMLQMTGGTYTDEATGATMPMMAGDAMTAVLPSMTAGQTLNGIQVTPLTAMAQTMAQHMSGGMTDGNITAANTNVGKYFMVADVLHNVPMNPLTAGSGNSATQDQINYGMALAAMSQYAQSQGMSSSSAMVTAMMNDAADGVMDGKMGSSDVMMGGMNMSMSLPSSAGTTGLATAMSAFVSSGQNHSGVAASTVQSLMNQLNGSNGQMMSGGTGTVAAGMVSGKVFNGEMSQGMVAAYAVNNGTRGAQIASTAMNSSGEFSMSLGNYTGPMMLQVTGGKFADEATGTTMSMGSSDVMTAVMASIASGAQVSGICITAVTSMAQARAAAMSGGMTDANITSANTAVGNYFMMGNPLTTQPIDMSMAGSGTVSGVTQDQMNHGAAIAAMSQYAHAPLGMSTSSAFVTAMMNDASDGTMNGMMGSTQIQMGGMMGGMGGMSNMMDSHAGTSDLATAMTSFMDSAMNHSGLTSASMNALIQKLSSSNGTL
jgi:hypothetical protein